MKVGDLVYHKNLKILGVGLIIDSGLEKRCLFGSFETETVEMFFVQFANDRRNQITKLDYKQLCGVVSGSCR